MLTAKTFGEAISVVENVDATRVHYVDPYELSPVGYWVLDHQGLIIETNGTAATLLDAARGALLNQPARRFIHRDDQELYRMHRAQLFANGTADSCEVRMVKTNGTEFWARLAACVAQDAGGAPVYRAIFNDISRHKEVAAAREKQEAMRRLVQKTEGLNRMAGAMAHHINNKIFGVTWCLKLVTTASLPSEQSIGLLNEAMKAANEMAEIGTQMMRYLGNTRSRLERLDLAEACRQMLPMLRATLPINVTLEAHLPPAGLVVHADEVQIRQVLINLIANAREAMGDGKGAIRLTVKTVAGSAIPAAPCFPVDRQPADNVVFACLEVEDGGVGIAAQNIEKIFDPFFTTKLTGRGLGLAVAQGIVGAHGGVVNVQSQPGCGSTFRVFLPTLVEAGHANGLAREMCDDTTLVSRDGQQSGECIAPGQITSGAWATRENTP